MGSEYKTFRIDKESAVDWLTLDRPERLNAINLAMVNELRDYFGGLPRDLFSDRAIALIYKKSRGIPRLINSLSDRCLLAAYARDQKKVTWNLVREAAKEVFGQRRPKKQRRVRTLGWSAAAAAIASTPPSLEWPLPTISTRLAT